MSGLHKTECSDQLASLFVESLDRMRSASNQLELDKACAIGEVAMYMQDRVDRLEDLYS